MGSKWKLQARQPRQVGQGVPDQEAQGLHGLGPDSAQVGGQFREAGGKQGGRCVRWGGHGHAPDRDHLIPGGAHLESLLGSNHSRGLLIQGALDARELGQGLGCRAQSAAHREAAQDILAPLGPALEQRVGWESLGFLGSHGVEHGVQHPVPVALA